VGVNEEEKATLDFNVEAINSADVSTNINPKTFSKNTLGVFPEFNSSSIASGSPDDLKLYIKSIKLSNSEDDQEDETIFSDSTGKAITIHSGKVDISSLFEATVVPEACTLTNEERFVFENTNVIAFNENNGSVVLRAFEEENNGSITLNEIVSTITCPHASSAQIQVAAKTYSNIKIEFIRRAKIKGCVTATFSSTGTKAGIAGKHTYCTQTGKSTFDNSDTTNDDFEKNTSQVMDIDLKVLTGRTTDKTESFSITYPIVDGITLTEGSTSSLTMLFDLNRMLRYFNNGRIDNQAPNPSAPNTFTYFYTLDLERDNVAYAFVGKAGSIFGYKSVLEACDDLPMPVDRVCTSVENTVGLWMTSVYDKNDKHIKTTFMPDDDNAFTAIKGSTDRLVTPIVDNNGTIDINFQLSTDGNGTVFDFKHADNIEDKVGGVTFEGLQESYGQVYMQRKL
jgi:hypothetical protein